MSSLDHLAADFASSELLAELDRGGKIGPNRDLLERSMLELKVDRIRQLLQLDDARSWSHFRGSVWPALVMPLVSRASMERSGGPNRTECLVSHHPTRSCRVRTD